MPLRVTSLDDPFELLLRHLMRRALMAAAVSSVIMAGAACETQTPPGGVGEPGDGGPSDSPPKLKAEGPAPTCEAGSSFPVRASGLNVEPSVDYLAIRRLQFSGPPDAGSDSDEWIARDFSVLSERGEACKTATSDACASKVKRHPARGVPILAAMAPLEYSVVTTAGDEVRRWAGVEELKALLGSIDTIDDAMLLVNAAGYDLHCNDAVATSVAEDADGYIVYATRVTSDCDPIVTSRFRLRVSRAGEISVLKTEILAQYPDACAGRKPSGLKEPKAESPGLGGFLARCAHLEAASVLSFERLAAELEAALAPQALIERARAARDDELRHARVVGELARKHGSRVEEVSTDAFAARSLEAMALENAIEGCVRETYGALLGSYQAMHAGDLTLRDAMTAIADDEIKHAALSHAVHAWLSTQLDPAARERIRRAQRDAIAELWLNARREPNPDFADLAGLPGAAHTSRMLGELSLGVWEPMLHAA